MSGFLVFSHVVLVPFVLQCGIQRVICVPCLVCVLRQGQHSSQGPRQVKNSTIPTCNLLMYSYELMHGWLINLLRRSGFSRNQVKKKESMLKSWSNTRLVPNVLKRWFLFNVVFLSLVGRSNSTVLLGIVIN